jgi:hypothetical protein
MCREFCRKNSVFFRNHVIPAEAARWRESMLSEANQKSSPYYNKLPIFTFYIHKHLNYGQNDNPLGRRRD